jgi:hypothetical protein
MIETSFVRWMQLREQEEGNNIPPGFDPFTTLLQKAGDIAYFGVHDLHKFHKKHGSLPNLELDQIETKSGHIVNADPVNQTITVATKRAPYHYGYHKLEDDKAKAKRKTDAEGNVLVTIPTSHLQNVSHMFGDGSDQTVWLVVDGGTKYQQGLMKEIRRQEVQKAAIQQQGSPMGGDEEDMPPLDDEGGEFDFGGEDSGGLDPMAGMGGFDGSADFDQMGGGSPMGGDSSMGMDDPSGGQGDFKLDPSAFGEEDPMMQGMDPSMGGMQGMDPSMGGMQGMDPSMGGMQGMDPSMGGMQGMGGMQPIKPKFKMKNREVVPSMGGEDLQVAHYNPSIMSNEWYWKRNADSRYYPYFPS